MTTTPVIREHHSSKGERPRSGSYCSSPSPPPLAVPAYYSPGHGRHQMSEEGEWLLQRQPNGTRGGGGVVPCHPAPTQGSPSDDLQLALLTNSNSNNNNNNNNRKMIRVSPPPLPSLPPPSKVAPKPSAYSSDLPMRHTTPSTTAQQRPSLPLSEASTLSHSDTPDPRYSSSMESGFDADVEQDPASSTLWYLTETFQTHHQRQQWGHPPRTKRRHASDSTAHRGPAHRVPRRGSAGDYDHLERCGGGGGVSPCHHHNKQSSYRLACGPRVHQLVGHHQKASRSLDSAEPSSSTPPLNLTFRPPQGVGRAPQQMVSFTAAAKTARNIHSRSKSDPDDLVVIEKATPTGHAHRSAKGSQSPCPLNPYYVNVNVGVAPSSPSHSRYTPPPLVSPSSNSAYHRLSGPGSRRGVADHTPHQRYPSSDESQGRGGGAEPGDQATPKTPSKVLDTRVYVH